MQPKQYSMVWMAWCINTSAASNSCRRHGLDRQIRSMSAAKKIESASQIQSQLPPRQPVRPPPPPAECWPSLRWPPMAVFPRPDITKSLNLANDALHSLTIDKACWTLKTYDVSPPSGFECDIFTQWFPQQEDRDWTQGQHHQDLLNYRLHRENKNMFNNNNTAASARNLLILVYTNTLEK